MKLSSIVSSNSVFPLTETEDSEIGLRLATELPPIPPKSSLSYRTPYSDYFRRGAQYINTGCSDLHAKLVTCSDSFKTVRTQMNATDTVQQIVICRSFLKSFACPGWRSNKQNHTRLEDNA